MPGSNDVSQNLDIIGQVPGDMLGRAADGWARIPAANLGKQLHAQGPDLVPIFVAGQPGVRLEKTINQNVLGGAFDAVIWNAALFDDASFWPGSNSTRINVPTGVARMRFDAGIRSETNTTGTVLVVIRDQAAVQIARQQDRDGSDSIGLAVSTGSIAVTPGDWYEVAFFTPNFRVLNANLMTFFAAEITRAL